MDREWCEVFVAADLWVIVIVCSVCIFVYAFFPELNPMLRGCGWAWRWCTGRPSVQSLTWPMEDTLPLQCPQDAPPLVTLVWSCHVRHPPSPDTHTLENNPAFDPNTHKSLLRCSHVYNLPNQQTVLVYVTTSVRTGWVEPWLLSIWGIHRKVMSLNSRVKPPLLMGSRRHWDGPPM